MAFAMAAMALPGAVHAGPAPQIAGFQAFLFNSRTGALSPDVLAAGTPLGNVPAGDQASVSTLVVVRVDFGKDMPIPDAAQVRLVASEAGPRTRGKPVARILLDRTSKIGPVAADGTTHIGFWLADTGCRTITLKATLLNGKAGATRDSELPFACYE
ncbi:MAG: hypothetical protein V4564_15990 [Pseudomonadota bacterium]|uniref:hypothetical protein n=1 Tax=Sphingomonas sp. ERG5 TaxID=1381597 RepID=UPI00054BF41E|nr:hypothetical protein [Sphingomonas sp. ERG5]